MGNTDSIYYVFCKYRRDDSTFKGRLWKRAFDGRLGPSRGETHSSFCGNYHQRRNRVIHRPMVFNQGFKAGRNSANLLAGPNHPSLLDRTQPSARAYRRFHRYVKCRDLSDLSIFQGKKLFGKHGSGDSGNFNPKSGIGLIERDPFGRSR